MAGAHFVVKKRTLYIISIAAIALIGGFLAYPLFAKNTEPVNAEEIYKLFLCPCCGKTIDARCCGMANGMITYIDSQIAQGLSKEEVILKAAGQYGINSVVESKRAEVEATLSKKNPDLVPKDKITFNQAAGKQAPDFTLESLAGKVKLSDYRGKIVVLFFNEGSMCYPACWNQISELGKDSRFNTENVVAFSILVDPKSEWENIVKKTPGFENAKILFDSSRAVSRAYDVLNLKSSMHPGTYPGHTYFIIDKDGIIRHTLDDPRMAIHNDLLYGEIKKLG